MIIVLLQSHTKYSDSEYDDATQSKAELNYFWCFDVEDKKWIKTNIENKWNNYSQIVKDKNILHIIDTGMALHFTIDLFDVIPATLMTKFQRKCEILVSGYIAVIKYDGIPHDIVYLVAKFLVVV